MKGKVMKIRLLLILTTLIIILLGFSNENKSKINSQKENHVSTLLKKEMPF